MIYSFRVPTRNIIKKSLRHPAIRVRRHRIVPEKSDYRSIVKELAGAVSVQARIANRAWLALMSVAFFAVLPHKPEKSGNLSLPFNLGEVNPVWFHAIVFSILVVLAIAFASAHAQQMRAQKLAQVAVDSLVASHSREDHVHPRELFDMLRTPSFNRVAPLAQLLRGKYQFYETGRHCPTWLLLGTNAFYALLKLTSLLVYFGLPFWAMWQAYANVLIAKSDFITWGARAGGLLSGSALILVLVAEIWYASGILKHLWTPRTNA
jgi:hypothetical protein